MIIGFDGRLSSLPPPMSEHTSTVIQLTDVSSIEDTLSTRIHWWVGFINLIRTQLSVHRPRPFYIVRNPLLELPRWGKFREACVTTKSS
jgi:hypothetical protein